MFRNRLMISLVFFGVIAFVYLPNMRSVAYSDELTLQRFSGKIIAIRYTDPLKSTLSNLAQFDVYDGRVTTYTFIVNSNTNIRSPKWGVAHVVYLREGFEVNVDYIVRSDKALLSKNVFVLQE